MKYKTVYDVLARSHTRIAYEKSGWRVSRPTYLDLTRPLWIVAESPKHNLRLWITHDSGNLTVTTARLDIDPSDPKYYKTQTRQKFRTQTGLAAYLRELLLPQEEGARPCAS